MDEFTAARYRVMRMLISECSAPDKLVLDLGAGRDPISKSTECRQRILMDIVIATQPTVVCDFLASIPLADSSVDLVVAGEILEHISESRRFLAQIRRVLRNKGYLVLSVPNIVSLKYRLAFLLGRIPALAAKADYTYAPDKPAFPRGHIRDYSFSEVRQVLADQGFRVVAQCSIGMHLNGKRVVPAWLMPVTFSDNVIVKAVLEK